MPGPVLRARLALMKGSSWLDGLAHVLTMEMNRAVSLAYLTACRCFTEASVDSRLAMDWLVCCGLSSLLSGLSMKQRLKVQILWRRALTLTALCGDLAHWGQAAETPFCLCSSFGNWLGIFFASQGYCGGYALGNEPWVSAPDPDAPSTGNARSVIMAEAQQEPSRRVTLGRLQASGKELFGCN